MAVTNVTFKVNLRQNKNEGTAAVNLFSNGLQD